jgi:Spy/CpxP family protein refolding chaperone
MTRRTATAAALLFLAACTSSAPSGSPGPARMTPDTADFSMEARGPGRAPPTFGLIGQREKLGLTSAQVTSIDSVGEDLRVHNEALLRHLRALQDSLGGRDRMTARTEQQLLDRGGPEFAQLRANNLQATRAIFDVLTPEQRVTTCSMIRAGTTGMGEGRSSSRQRGEGPGGYGRYGGQDRYGQRRRMQADSLRERRQSVLFWCPADSTKPVVRP